MARKAQVLFTVRDVDNFSWDVREERITKHGFSVLLGWREGRRGKGFGGPRLIPTAELIGFFESHRGQRTGIIYDLPIGKTAIKRLRLLFGLNYYSDYLDWWLERFSDLAALPGKEFAKKHNVLESSVSIAHKHLLGNRKRPARWWEDPHIASIINGENPIFCIAEQLDMTVGSVRRLRAMLKDRHEPQKLKSQSNVASELARLRWAKTDARSPEKRGGRPRETDKPRCDCKAFTLHMATIRCHKCPPNTPSGVTAK